MGARKDIPIEELKRLIDQSKGNISAAARAKGVDRHTLKKRINESPEALRALDDAQETMVDLAESALYAQVLAGNITAIIFFLKANPKARQRGWTERHEIAGVSGGPVKIEVVYTDDDAQG